MPLYCAYCGKEFSRQEHLERHILTHTNVKPYRCPCCQLSFTRKDLLHRHMMNSHQSKVHTGSLPRGVCGPITGRNLIACQNCASAKTGCDKKVPCSRCVEKNLQCAARYARRSSKTALRATQTTAPVNQQIFTQSLRESHLQRGSSTMLLTGNGVGGMMGGSLQVVHECTAPQPKIVPQNQNALSPPPEPYMDLEVSESFTHHLDDPEVFKIDEDWSTLLSWPENPVLPVNLNMYNHDTGPEAQALLLDTSDTSTASDQQVTPPLMWSPPIIFPDLTDFDGIQKPQDVISSNHGNRMVLDFNNVVASEEARSLERFQLSHIMALQKFRQTGMLEQSHRALTQDNLTSMEQQWASRSRHEEQNRFVYSWVMVDQELSLLYDTGPLLSVADLERPLPGPELWLSKTSPQFVSDMQQIHSNTTNGNLELHSSPHPRPSLNKLFKDFLCGDLSTEVLPQHLRLLLYPLQSLIHNLRHLLSCIDDSLSLTKSNTESSLKEAQLLLQRWHKLAMETHKTSPDCPETTTSLILYHLISLAVVTSFPEIERLAFREGPGGAYWQLCLLNKKCIYDSQEAIFHCRQVFSFLRGMRADHRPYWWVYAVYRATLILWTQAILQIDTKFGNQEPLPAPTQTSPLDPSGSFNEPTKESKTLPTKTSTIAINQSAPGDSLANQPLRAKNTTIILTRQDGSTVTLNSPTEVLRHGITFINEGPKSDDGEEMKNKLTILDQGWGGFVTRGR